MDFTGCSLTTHEKADSGGVPARLKDTRDGDIFAETSADEQADEIDDSLGEKLSPRRSPVNLDEVEIPPDVPDGPMFADLAGFIDRVAAEDRNVIDTADGLQDHPVRVAGMERENALGVSQNVLSGDFPTSEDYLRNTLAINSSLETKIHCNCPSLEGAESSSDPFASTQAERDSPSVPVKKLSAYQSGKLDEFANFDNLGSDVVVSDEWADEPITSAPSDENVFKAKRDDNINFNSQDNEDEGGEFGSTGVSNDEDFGDFECSVPAVVPTISAVKDDHIQVTNVPKVQRSSGVLERILEYLEPALAKLFSLNDATEIDDWILAYQTERGVKNKTPLTPKDDEFTFKPCSSDDRVRQRLFCKNRLHEYRHQWNRSSVYEAYMHAVNVDVRNAMPAFASQLRLLEPIRLGASVARTTSTSSALLTTNSGTEPINKNCPRSPQDHGGGENRLNCAGASEASVPEFDWRSSGLTNPLDGANPTSHTLDLDYLEIQRNGPKLYTAADLSKISNLEVELLSDFCKPAPAPPPKLPLILERNPPPKPRSFRENVRAALANLPKLSYMRSPTLLFPVSDQAAT
ncbi:unnamed protein product [Calicophoron daubneyi]|uniref:Uncharacterized protein n=1 Tax=Calicophoron daubneyi TaxID=300641 RepID=A0AAV2TML4_CALDB